MSYAMAPQKSFIQLIKILAEDYKIVCQKNKPVWTCSGLTMEKYFELPSIKFSLISGPNGETKEVEMPKHAYMQMDPTKPNTGRLLFIPWIFKGDEKSMDMKDGEEYWILGAQFL